MASTHYFGDLKVSDEFYVYGDLCINYNYPKVCHCVKTGVDNAKEIDGINFSMDAHDEIMLEA